MLLFLFSLYFSDLDFKRIERKNILYNGMEIFYSLSYLVSYSISFISWILQNWGNQRDGFKEKRCFLLFLCEEKVLFFCSQKLCSETYYDNLCFCFFLWNTCIISKDRKGNHRRQITAGVNFSVLTILNYNTLWNLNYISVVSVFIF